MSRFFPGVAAIAALALVGCQKAEPAANNAAPASAPVATATNAAPAPAVALTGDAGDVKSFLDGLYAHYKSSKDSTYSPLDKNAPDVFDEEMIALMKADNKANHGEVGALDSDTICECQDYESIKATVTVQSATPTAATATAVFADTGMTGDDAKPRTSTFDLVKTPAGWRIHDIHAADMASMRKILQDDIAQAKKLPANAF